MQKESKRGTGVMELGFGFYSNAEKNFSKEEVNEFFLYERNYYILYVEKKWLDRYWRMKVMERNVQVPSINSVISDMPSGGGGTNNSKTEIYALKSVEAGEWVSHFHTVLDSLPEELKRLIEIKYLEIRQSDGKPLPDKNVIEKLFIGKTKYTEMKKDALEELGRSLYRSYDNN